MLGKTDEVKGAITKGIHIKLKIKRILISLSLLHT
jgi:hypothetical protein